MAEIQTGGPAFPEITGFHQRQHAKEKQRLGYDTQCEGGMTLRDYFAGQALAGIYANKGAPVIATYDSPQSRASICYAMADAMLAARGEAV